MGFYEASARVDAVARWVIGIIAAGIVTILLSFVIGLIAPGDVALVFLIIGVSLLAVAWITNFVVNLMDEQIPPRTSEEIRQSRLDDLPRDVKRYQQITYIKLRKKRIFSSGYGPARVQQELEWLRDYLNQERLPSDFPDVHQLTWALEMRLDPDLKLSLAQSYETDEEDLTWLNRDESSEVREAARLTLATSPKVEKQRAIGREAAECARQTREAEQRKEEQAREAAAERFREERELSRAKSTDTPKEELRRIATTGSTSVVRRSAIETLALLNQAGV